MKNIRLGKREREVLGFAALQPQGADLLVGFLLSACSSSRMMKIAHEQSKLRVMKGREESDRHYRDKQILARLEKKSLIRLSGLGEQQKIILTSKGKEKAELSLLSNKVKKPEKERWNKKWTVVTFDVPMDYSHLRYSLRHLLVRCGFEQTQMSTYVFPGDCFHVVNYLADNPKLGQFCQVFYGTYKGDDGFLRKKFEL